MLGEEEMLGTGGKGWNIRKFVAKRDVRRAGRIRDVRKG